MNSTLKRQKSITSQAASISAWWAVFDWFSIVAATRVERQGPASSSAARRKTAARSSHGRRCQSSQAFAEASTAFSISPAPPLCTCARTWSLSCGMTASKVVPVLISSPPITHERECDRLAELSALFHFAGRLHLLGRGEVSVHLDLASAAVARRAFGLLRSFDVGSEIRTYRRRAFGQETRYQLHVDDGLGLLKEAGVVDAKGRPRERPPRRVLGRGCCCAAYLRGALLAAGS